ncbi:MAG: TRAP transporter small permease subunit [Desulfobacterales bacterium]
MIRGFRRIDRWLSLFEEWTLFLSVLAAMIALFFNVVLRYGFSYSLAWSEELVREVILYTTFVGCSAAIRSRATVRIDAVVQLVPRLQYPLALFSYGVQLVFAVILIYYGVQLCALQVKSGQSTLILNIPTVYLYALLPLLGVLMILRVLMMAAVDIRARRSALGG